jgi:hypothetical protein
MKKFLNALLIVGLLFLSHSAFAEVGCKVNGSQANCKSDVITNLDFKAQVGSTVLTQTGLTMPVPTLSSNMFATGVANGGATSMVSTTNAVPVGYDFIKVACPSNSDPLYTAKTLANGTPGQILTLEVVQLTPSNGATGGNCTITPTLSYGWSTLKLSAVGDIVQLHFVDTNTGWVVTTYDPGASNSITLTDVGGQ